MDRLVRAVLLIAALMLSARPSAAAPPDTTTVWERAHEELSVLTADSMRGRGYAFGGHERAARYLRTRFQRMGLDSLSGGYLQPFPLRVTTFPHAPRVRVAGDSLVPGRGFVPYGGSAAGSLSVRSPVRVGHGAVIPEEGIDPYPDLNPDVSPELTPNVSPELTPNESPELTPNESPEPTPDVRVAGSVLVMEARLPDSLRSFRRGPGSVAARLDTAAARGARAVVLLTDRLIFSPAAQDVEIPAVYVKRSEWPGESSVDLQNHARQNQGFLTQNVIARKPGTAPAGSTIVVTAHYDHLGCIGPRVCFPGANDNASGTAMLLRLAEAFADRETRHDLVFVGFSGEEEGLHGSIYFAARPPIELKRVRLLVNLDMVGAGEGGIMVEGGTDYGRLYERIGRLADSLGVGPLDRRANVPNSDHFPFVRRGVRGIFLYAIGGDQAYHHVDDVTETLDAAVFREVYRLAEALVAEYAGTRESEPSNAPSNGPSNAR